MKVTKEIENVGTIRYEESALTGKKALFLDGEKMTRKSKTHFEYVKDEVVTQISLEGNVIKGVNLVVNGEKYEVLQKTAWYEYLVAFIGFVVILIWGNVPALFEIFPVIAGVIGGLIGALGAILGIYMMRVSRNPAIRLLIGLAGSIIAILICALIGFAIVSAFS